MKNAFPGHNVEFFFPPLNIYKFCYRLDGIEVHTCVLNCLKVAFLFKELQKHKRRVRTRLHLSSLKLDVALGTHKVQYVIPCY